MTPTRLRRQLIGLGFIDEFSPLYAVLTVYLAENGLDAAQIALIFTLWAGTGIVFEVPSGALADRVDRRVLLAVSFVLRAVGISLWLIDPSFSTVLVGAALWALHSALASGAFEAMIHDQLAAVGAADQYQATMGRIHQASVAGIASGSLLGAGLLAVDVSFEVLGWFTVLAHAASIAAVLVLPKAGAIEDDPEGLTFASWWRTLRDGLAVVRRRPMIRRLLLLAALLEGTYLLDEFVPLVADARGAGGSTIALLYFVILLGPIVGDEVVVRVEHLSGRVIGAILAGAYLVATAALLVDAVPALAAIALAYGGHEIAWVVSDARIQAGIDDATRATVLSVRSLGAGVSGMATFAGIGALSSGTDPTPGMVVLGSVLVVIGLFVVASRIIPAATENGMAVPSLETGTG